MATTIVSEKWQIVIPSAIRSQLKDIKPRQTAIVKPYDEKSVLVEFVKDPISASIGVFATKDKRPVVDELIKERRQEDRIREQKLDNFWRKKQWKKQKRY